MTLGFHGSIKAVIERSGVLSALRTGLKRSEVVALIGPRQCGKTTAARWILPPDSPKYFDLEDPASLARLDEPMLALEPLRGVVVIDEVQRRPDLFPILRVLADRRPRVARFLILGSASPALLKQSSETLAGRIEVITLEGFSLEELGVESLKRHWLRGGFPPAYLARTEADSFNWRKQYIQTLLERDLPQLGIQTPAQTMRRFWTMVAHYHANVWNGAELARSLGISQPTVRHYLDLMTDLFLLRQLPPWHENLKKRQVRSPKIYVRDSGLLHQLLGIHVRKDLFNHPKLGGSWEGYALEEIMKTIQPDDAYFWATHQGAELDLLLFRNGRRYGVEIKRTDAPTLTPSITTAMEDLGLAALSVLYPGSKVYDLAKNVRAIPLSVLASEESKILTIPVRRKR